MRTAVLRVVVDPVGEMTEPEYAAGLSQLRASGLVVVASPYHALPPRDREVELFVDDFREAAAPDLLTQCSRAFGRPASAGTTTWVSRGTDDDVRGVLDGFGLHGRIDRDVTPDDELVVVTLTADELRRVPESRLFTALQAALNCEVRILVDDA